MKFTKNLGMLLLAIWLIIGGLAQLVPLGFSGLGTVMAVLAIGAGILILAGR
jgi:hypothetical protein